MSEYTFALDQAVRPELMRAGLDGGVSALLMGLTQDPSIPDCAHAARLASAADALAALVAAEPVTVARQCRDLSARIGRALDGAQRAAGGS